MLAQEKLFDDLFTQLQQSQCPLQVSFQSGIRHLAAINRLKKGWFNKFFYIEIDGDIAETLKPEFPLELCFEFWDEDNIRHVFKTQGVKFEQQLLKVKYPVGIERCQQRHFYRVEVPEKTLLTFFLNGRRQVMRLKDISSGGCFGTLIIQRQSTTDNPPQLKVNAELTHLRLEARLPGRQYSIQIAAARVARIRPQGPRRFGFGLQFITIAREQKAPLKQFVRDLERYYLCCQMVVKHDLG